MPVVTSIKPQKNKKKANVYLDGKFGFGIDLENFMKLRLKVGQELTDEEVSEILKKAEFQKILDKLLRFVTLRPRSVSEIKQWVKRKKVYESLHSDLFNRLKRLDLIDDEKFAKWWIEQRITFRPKPKRVLERELITKGVEKEVIDKVLSDLEIDEVEIAKKLAAKRKDTDKDKVATYLARKGFNWETIKRVIDEVKQKS